MQGFHFYMYVQYVYVCEYQTTITPEIIALLIFMRLIFVVIYYSQFQEAVNICCIKNAFKLNFCVLNFHGFFQPWIINNRENFQNRGTCSVHWQVRMSEIFMGYTHIFCVTVLGIGDELCGLLIGVSVENKQIHISVG